MAADGSFRIGGLSPGKALMYVYSVENFNRHSFNQPRVERDGVDQTQGVEIPPGQSVSNVRVFISYGTGVIRGTTKFENGSPRLTRVSMSDSYVTDAPSTAERKLTPADVFLLQTFHRAITKWFSISVFPPHRCSHPRARERR